jgi:chromosome segregation ATPase
MAPVHSTIAFVAAGATAVGAAELRGTSLRSGAQANPIRKVVTMLDNIKAKVEAEGEKEEQIHKEFMCYCATSGGDLKKTIQEAEAKAPETAAAIEEGTAKKAQLDEDLVAHKADREAAKAAMAEATGIREKGAADYAATKADLDANAGAIAKAVAALEKGMGGSFLQTNDAAVLRNVVQAKADMDENDRQDLTAFLAASAGSDYAPQGGQVTGILKQLGDEMNKDLADATAAEEASKKSHGELMTAKTKEVEALTTAIEEKTVRVGELAVEIVNMKNDLGDMGESLVEDKKFLADLDKNCATKAGEWDEIQKVRAEELLALADTIKLLNDDDALDLFKKALPGAASFMQVGVRASEVKARALKFIQAARRKGQGKQQLAFIALALQGKQAGFEKVTSMVDEMVALLKKEQTDDDAKKEYCGTELDSKDDEKKALDRSISDSEKAIAVAEEGIVSLTEEIKGLVDGIKELDKSVAEATENRKKENEAYKELMAQDGAAKEIIGIAKNRLKKFYNPKLYNPPPKREMTEEERISVNMGGTLAPTPAPGGIAGTGVTVFAQISAHRQLASIADADAPPPAPESVGPFSKKTEESTGVIAMMDMLIKDLDKEMTVAETDEKNAQEEYEEAMTDSAAKREADSKSVSAKESSKADTEAALQSHKDAKGSAVKELAGVAEAISALHGECDWLLKYFDARKEARSGEIDSLSNAKAVLSGADYA